jgi:autotransporter-associated beta strand protein
MDATGTGSSTLALGASQSIASLAGASTSTVTLGSNTLTIGTSSDNTTYAGRITGSNSSALVKDGASTQVLSGNNSAFTGTTTINSGTLEATATNALGSTTVINVNGGSFLVTAENAVNDNAAINLNGGRMAVSGTFNETVGALTLSANSTLDFAGFVGTLRFSGIGSWASGANLAIWNWSGTTQYGTQINNYGTPSNLVFSNNSTLTSNLANISFYSDSGNSFVGSGFEVTGFSGGGSEIIAVPETETYFYAVALLAGIVIQYLRRRAKRNPLEGHRPA